MNSKVLLWLSSLLKQPKCNTECTKQAAVYEAKLGICAQYPVISLTTALGASAGYANGPPELAGGGLGGVAGDQQVAPVQVSVLKLTSLLCNRQTQSSLQAATTCFSAIMAGSWQGTR